MGEFQDQLRDELTRVAVIDLGRQPEVESGEKVGHFFTTLGAPAPGVGGEKVASLFTTAAVEQSMQVADPERHVGQAARTPARRAAANQFAAESSAAGQRLGRPNMFTPPFKERLLTLLSIGLSRRQAAAYLEIDHTTITRAAARDEELAGAMRLAEDRADMQPMLTVIAESRKNWRAAAWLLRYKDAQPRNRSEQEKKQLHEEKLADNRRSAEELVAWMDAATEASRATEKPIATAEVKRLDLEPHSTDERVTGIAQRPLARPAARLPAPRRR